MRKSRFGEERNVKMLREVEQSSVAAVAKKHGVSTAVAQDAAAFIVLLCGCYVSDGTHGDAAEPKTTDESVLETAVCNYLQRCYPEGLQHYPGGTLEGCLGARSCALSQGAVRSGLDPLRCAETLDEDPCTMPLDADSVVFERPTREVRPLTNTDSPCSYLWTSLRDSELHAPGEGEVCLRAEFACKPGLHCIADVPLRQSGSSWCGVCTAGANPGDACGGAIWCANGRCVDGTCVALLQDGAPCDEDAECSSRECDGAQCRAWWTTGGARTDAAALGQPCDSATDCGPDLSLACVDLLCVRRPDQGEMCDSDNDCRVGQACSDGRCQIDNCQPCGGACPANTWCDPLDNVCKRKPGRGEACEWVCADDLVCEPGEWICRTAPMPRQDGQPCTDDWDCNNHCVRDLAPFCSVEDGVMGSCVIPRCDQDCGVCAEDPGLAGCM